MQNEDQPPKKEEELEAGGGVDDVVFEEHQEDTAPSALIEERFEEEVPAPQAKASSPELTSEQTTNAAAGTYTVALPSTFLAQFTEAVTKFTEALKEVSPEKEKWKAVAEEAVEFYTPAGLYQDRLTESGSNFQQGVSDSNGKLATISPVKFKQGTGELKGEIALLKVSKMLGLGDVVNVLLPHSGIWVTIKPPTERDLIDFYNTVFREKIMFGRSTSGLTFSNFSVHMNHRLFEFILRHIHSLNYGDIPKEDLGNYIVIHDFPVLAHGLARCMYPNGFDFQRGCVTDLNECTYVAKETLLLEKLLWIDNSALSLTQRNILSENRPNKLTLEAYRTFVSEHSRVAGSTFTTTNGITFKLKIPTFSEYTTDGLAWVNGISNTVENVMLSTNDDDEGKAELLGQYVKTSILKQFNHFIDSIEVDEEVVTDRDTINQLLEVFSSDDDIREELIRGVIAFKSKTTIGIIGIEEYTCPACGKPHEPNAKTLPRFTKVIPLDSVNLFFLMLTSKISKILERST